MFWRGRRVLLAGLAIALIGGALGGCELLYLAGGKGKQKALFKFPKDKQVLVLVDVREGIAAPAAFTTTLGDKITAHLFKYKATDHVISQDKLVQLQQNNPEIFKQMGIADVAQATGADLIVSVFVTQITTPLTSDGTVDEGHAEAFVKVVDRKGTRLYPGSATGVAVVAHDDPALVSDRNVDKTVQDLVEQLSTRTGRMFHDFDLEDKEMIGRGERP